MASREAVARRFGIFAGNTRAGVYYHAQGGCFVATDGQVLAVYGAVGLDAARKAVATAQPVAPSETAPTAERLAGVWPKLPAKGTLEIARGMRGDSDLHSLGLQTRKAYILKLQEIRKPDAKERAELRKMERELAKGIVGAWTRAVRVGPATVDLEVVDRALKLLGSKGGKLTSFGALEPLLLECPEGTALVMPFRA